MESLMNGGPLQGDDPPTGPPQGSYIHIAPASSSVILRNKSASVTNKGTKRYAKRVPPLNKTRILKRQSRANASISGAPSRIMRRPHPLQPNGRPVPIPPFIPRTNSDPISPSHHLYPQPRPTRLYTSQSMPYLPPDLPRVVSTGPTSTARHTPSALYLPPAVQATTSTQSHHRAPPNFVRGSTQDLSPSFRIQSMAPSEYSPQGRSTTSLTPRMIPPHYGAGNAEETRHLIAPWPVSKEKRPTKPVASNEKWLDSDTDDDEYSFDMESDMPLSTVFDKDPEESTSIASFGARPDMDDKRLFALLCKFTRIFCPIKDLTLLSDTSSSDDGDSGSEMEVSESSSVLLGHQGLAPGRPTDSWSLPSSPSQHRSPRRVRFTEMTTAAESSEESPGTLSPAGRRLTTGPPPLPSSPASPGAISSVGSLSFGSL